MSKEKSLKIFAWSLSSVVTAVALLAWLQSIDWNISGISTYELFPLFGLLAFSIMWSHYIVSVVREYLKIDKEQLKTYIEVTSFVVLVAIFLHPGLLVWQLWRDGFGLPPESYIQNYVSPSLRWAAVLGTVSLFVFFAYELRRRYSAKTWWKYIFHATNLAMVAVFIHSLKLGTNLQSGWLQVIWYFYGLTLFSALGYIYWQRYKDIKLHLHSR